jgi:hypothetical protein
MLLHVMISRQWVGMLSRQLPNLSLRSDVKSLSRRRLGAVIVFSA